MEVNCNLYVCNLYKMPRFGGSVFRSVLSRKTNFSSSNSMSRIEKVAHGGSFVICIYMTYIKRQDLVVQFSVVL